MTMRRWEPATEGELGEAIEAARAAAAKAPARPRARSARYDEKTNRIEIELRNGCLFAFPAGDTEGLAGGTAEQLAAVEVIGEGTALHWEELDADYSIDGLLAGHLGSSSWMREHARRAGSATSEAKARAARRNGRKGGRPKKSRDASR